MKKLLCIKTELCTRGAVSLASLVQRAQRTDLVQQNGFPAAQGRPLFYFNNDTSILPTGNNQRLDLQVTQSVEESNSELPIVCARGTKKNAKGYKMSWNGYKLHLDTNDIGLRSVPLSPLRPWMTAQ